MRKSPDIVTRKIADTTVLVSLKFGEEGFFAYHLDEVSAFLWDALDEPMERGALAQKLCEEFSVPLGQALQDVQCYLADLEKAGLLV